MNIDTEVLLKMLKPFNLSRVGYQGEQVTVSVHCRTRD